jgi:hypothetical protein
MSFVPPEKRLMEGAAILDKKLKPLGFSFKVAETGKGSGGDFAIGTFTAGDREIRVWFRFHLGAVTYRKGTVEASHQALMQCLGLEEKARYPGFQTDNPLEGFQDLLADLEHCSLFLEDEGKAFEKAMRGYKYSSPPKGFGAILRSESK